MKKIKIAFIGLTAGIISGLFGTGGGLILVPALVYIINLQEIEARGTAIACILPMVITSGVFYYNGNCINWVIGLKCAIGGTIGAIIGAILLKKISVFNIKVFFIIFLVYVGMRMLLF